MQKTKITIYDMAKKADVSIATISRVVNRETRGRVALKTLKRIDQLVQKYRYAPNLAAKNLSKAAFNTIGVVLPHLRGIFFSDYYSNLFSGVSDAILESHYRFKMVMLKPGKEKWDHYDFKNAEGVDGLVLTHWPLFFSSKKAFQNIKIPCVIVFDAEVGIQVPYVCCDNEAGGRLAGEYLIKKGHKKIAVLTGAPWSENSRLRLKGFRDCLKTHGIKLEPSLIQCANYQEGEAKEKVKDLIQTRKKFTALFCLNDGMALGTIAGMKSLGLKCPQDISVMGFDDERRSAYSDPALTTIHYPMYEIAKWGTQILLEDLAQGKAQRKGMRRQIFPVYLAERQSVA